MTEINSMGVAFYIAAFLICMTCVVYTFIQNHTGKLQKKFYLAMLVIMILNTVSETVVEIVTPHRMELVSAHVVLSACKYLYFILHTAMLTMLSYYVLSITGRLHRLTKAKNILLLIPVAAVELLMITNPIHHWCYSFDSIEYNYHRSWGVTALYIVSAFYILFFIINLFRSWKAMTGKRRISLAYFLTMVITGIIIQCLFIDIRVELFAESIAYLGLLITVEDEGDLIDNDIGMYNRKALRIDADNYFANKQAANLLCVKIENSDIVRRVTGSENTDILSQMIYDELVKYVSRYNIYQTAPDTFVILLIKEKRERVVEILYSINDRFEKSWNCQYSEIMLTATTMFAALPEDIGDTNDLFNMVDGSLPHGHKKCLIGKEDLGYILRRRAIESSVQHGIEKGGFEVYYQPTFSADGLSVFGAEALVRLHDDKLGELLPDEFIPLSERMGLIGEVDDFVLKTVCAFIASGVPDRLGIGSINVNLSVLQCVKPGFVEHIVSIVDESGIDRSRVNFEITESVDASDYDVMRSVVKQFRVCGFRMYLDDFGTGYANVQALFSMDFNVIKIDKSILWGANNSELGMILLENNIRMLRQMDLGILVEGVETEEQVRLLGRLGVDCLQGFYFSRPVPERKLVELLGSK